MSTPVTIIPGTLAYSCYPPDPQTINEDIINGAVARLDEEFPGIYKGPTAPPVEYQDRVWFNTTDHEWYDFLAPNWVRPHSVPPSGSERRLWIGTAAQLETYDGGAAGAVSDAAGPMWEIDTAFEDRFPIGVKTATTYGAATATATGGEATHALTAAETQHMHGVGTDGAEDDPAQMLHRTWDTTPDGYPRRYIDLGPGNGNLFADGNDLTSGTMSTTKAITDPDNASTAHNNVPPFYGVHFIKRTARKYIVA